jgi:glutathione peroxidase-family protein
MTQSIPRDPSLKSIYDIELSSAEGQPNFMQQFKGQVTLVVNTTVGCGNANQMEVLEWLYRKYKSKGFSVVALPTNDYCGPGVTKGKWSQGLVCGLDSKNYGEDVYGTTFPYSEKVNSNPNRELVGDANGVGDPFSEPSEIYVEIMKQVNNLREVSTAMGIGDPVDEYYSYWLNQGFYHSSGLMAANFEKYLVDKDGFVIAHYTPSVLQLDVEKTLKDQLLEEWGLEMGDLGAERSRREHNAELEALEKGIESPYELPDGKKGYFIAADHQLHVAHNSRQAPGPGHGRSYKIFEEEFSVVSQHIENALNGNRSFVNPNYEKVKDLLSV